MAFDLRKEVEELRKRGASLGLNQDDIDYAILKSLGETGDSNHPKHKHTKTKFTICKWIFIVMTTFFCIMFLLVGGMIVATENNKQFALLVGRTFADMTYPVVRLVRLATLPIHQLFDVTEMYSWECILQNPSYVPSSPDCEVCSRAIRVPIKASTLLPQPQFKEKFYEPGFSVIVRNVSGYGDQNHTYEEFLEVYQANKNNLDKDACEFYLGQGYTAKKLGDLLEKWEHHKPDGHVVGWKLCYGKGFREIRKLYQRPYFVHSEGSLEKMMQLLQPAGKYPESVQLPRTSFDNVWLAQVDGSTEVALNPIADCEKECKSHTVNLIKGDVLFYTQQMWTVTITNREQIPGILFVSSFA